MTPVPNSKQPKPAGKCAPVLRFGRLTVLTLWLVMGAVLMVNAQSTGRDYVIPADVEDNVFQHVVVLPQDLRRVLVLPLACEASPAELSDGCTTLNAVLLAQLIKTQRFEAVPADPTAVRRLTGRLTWTGEEILPPDFFDALRAEYGCDAVLFCQLTVYQTFPPMAIGWRMKLVDVRTRQILWAVDDTFNAAYHRPNDRVNDFPLPIPQIFSAPAGRWLRENSPRQFGQATLAKLFTTLPWRAESAKVSPKTADAQGGQWSKSRR